MLTQRAAFIAAVIALLAGCAPARKLVVGSKSSTEQIILGEIAALQIERKLNRKVDRQLGLGDTLLAHQSLQGGQIDLYPEYTGTAALLVMREEPATDPTVVLERVRLVYRGQMGAEWLDPLGFDGGFAIAIREADATSKSIASLSDLEKSATEWRIALTREFQDRPDGLAAVNKRYAIRWKGAPRAMSDRNMFDALKQQAVEAVGTNRSDGLLNEVKATVLRDDKGVFPPCQAAIVVRQDTLTAVPGLREALAAISGRIDEATMRRLNFEVDSKGRAPAEVAAEWLKSVGM